MMVAGLEPEELLWSGEGIGVRTRGGGKASEWAGDGGSELQIEPGIGPGSIGDPPVPSGDSPDGMEERARVVRGLLLKERFGFKVHFFISLLRFSQTKAARHI